MIGETVSGRYRIDAQLGIGGMGIVYKAYDTRLERYIALKVVAPHLVQVADARTRFLREARVLAGISHPNIVTVHDLVDDASDGSVCIVMELLQGESLRQAMSRPNRPPLAEVAAQLTRALECAHARGVLHRDIKPENVFVCEGGVLKLMDFGLARLVGAASNTQSNMAVGTVAYMAPEQLKGQQIDGRADLYGLGILLYEYAAGSPPFTADNPGAVLMKHITAAPEPLTSRVPGFNAGVDAIILRLLAKDPGARFQDAASVRGCLEEALARMSAEVSGISTGRAVAAGPGGPLPQPGHGPAAASGVGSAYPQQSAMLRSPGLPAANLPYPGNTPRMAAPGQRRPVKVTLAQRRSSSLVPAILLVILLAAGASAWVSARLLNPALPPARPAARPNPLQTARSGDTHSRRRRESHHIQRPTQQAEVDPAPGQKLDGTHSTQASGHLGEPNLADGALDNARPSDGTATGPTEDSSPDTSETASAAGSDGQTEPGPTDKPADAGNQGSESPPQP